MTFKQGDIVKLDFDPTLGHEQAGYRPALVVSKDLYNSVTGLIAVCPITTKAKPLPMRVPLDERTKTRGFIICDQIRTIDTRARNPKYTETLPGDILDVVTQTVSAIFL